MAADDATDGSLPLNSDADVVRARHRVRELAISIDLDLVTQTKLITAASELGRNTWLHGGGGTLEASIVRHPTSPTERLGVRLRFVDTGPGIADMTLALTSGWTTGNGLGLGLPGAQRLVHEFDIESEVGAGTTITTVTWRRS
jgi:serine/threonine-protein kinase RsbT